MSKTIHASLLVIFVCLLMHLISNIFDLGYTLRDTMWTIAGALYVILDPPPPLEFKE